jgi:hypothetical protein
VTHFISSSAHTAKSAIKTVYNDAKQIVTNTLQIPKQIINKGAQIAGKVVDKTGDIVKTGEYGLMLPLAAVGIGLAFLFARSNPNTIQTVGSAAVQRL